MKSSLGYILVETLITVTILAVGLTLVLNALGSEIHALRISKNYIHAGLLLEEKLAQIEKDREIDINLPIREEGSFPDEYKNFTWRIEKSIIKDTNLIEVKVTIEWKETFTESKRDLSATIFLPKKSS